MDDFVGYLIREKIKEKKRKRYFFLFDWIASAKKKNICMK